MITAGSPDTPDPSPLLLSQRLGDGPAQGSVLRLALSADDRTRLRGLRHSVCGHPLLLQLPRGEPLRPGELIADHACDQLVRVEASQESLLRVIAPSTLALLQAAYHLGNRHVALEVHPQELRLLADSVLEQMLRQRGLQLDQQEAPFCPEGGAYGSAAHHHHA